MHLVWTLLLAQAVIGPIGVEVRFDEMDGRSRVFVDLAKAAQWSAARLDEAGWPAADARATFFNLGNTALLTDPRRAIPDYSGTYRLSFKGQAAVAGARIENARYDEAANTTTADVVVPRGAVSLELTFTGTRREPGAETNTGITDVRLIRPGYAADSKTIFTADFLRALAPFGTLGFKTLLRDANYDTEPLYPDTTEWSDRHTPADATQQQFGGRRKNGVAHEYLVLLANMTGKDMWINIPVSASDGYVTELAQLLRRTLRPDLKVYVEYSQSIHAAPSPGYRYASAAIAANPADAQLKDPPTADPEDLIRRWHARRLIQIGKLFEAVYGEEAMGRSVRMVERWWARGGDDPVEEDAVLRWVDRHFGPPSRYFWGLAAYHMYYDAAPPGSSAAAVAESYRAAADRHLERYLRPMLERAAAPWGLRPMVFAGGPALWMQVGPTHAEAFRSREMGEAFAHDLRDNWFALGGDLYVHWGLAGGYDRLIEDVRQPDGPRYRAMRALAAEGPEPAIDEITVAPEGVAVIRGRDFTPNEVTWDAARPEWTDALPIALDGVMVRIAGRDCAVRRVSPNQVEALLPGDLEAGAHEVEVHTNRGAARATLQLEPGMVHSSECRKPPSSPRRR